MSRSTARPVAAPRLAGRPHPRAIRPDHRPGMGPFSEAPRATGGNYRVLFIVSAAMLVIVLMAGLMAAVARASVSGGGTRFGSGRSMDAHWDDADKLVPSVGDSLKIQLRNVRPRRFLNPRDHQALHTTYVLFCSSSSIRIRGFCVMNDEISPGRNCVMADVFAQRLTTPSMPAAWSGGSAVSWSTSSRMRWRGARVLFPRASLELRVSGAPVAPCRGQAQGQRCACWLRR
ncbi:hypothetical protein BRPE67_ECDS02920 (plasmid) [Caballeronia cordobensis]|nr:hypothetical protein BRPE67_ECDS02920 [Burkholderia sp. RPE67]